MHYRSWWRTSRHHPSSPRWTLRHPAKKNTSTEPLSIYWTKGRRPLWLSHSISFKKQTAELQPARSGGLAASYLKRPASQRVRAEQTRIRNVNSWNVLSDELSVICPGCVSDRLSQQIEALAAAAFLMSTDLFCFWGTEDITEIQKTQWKSQRRTGSSHLDPVQDGTCCLYALRLRGWAQQAEIRRDLTVVGESSNVSPHQGFVPWVILSRVINAVHPSSSLNGRRVTCLIRGRTEQQQY